MRDSGHKHGTLCAKLGRRRPTVGLFEVVVTALVDSCRVLRSTSLLGILTTMSVNNLERCIIRSVHVLRTEVCYDIFVCKQIDLQVTIR